MRDLKIEQLLDGKPNVAWEYREAVPIASIDRKKSESNQARIEGPIDNTLVEQYVQAYKSGDRFPAVVVYIDGNDFVNIDGNHRYEMYSRCEVGHTDAYVVLTEDPKELLALTFEMNTLNGRPADEEDRDQQAITLAARGFAHKDIAKRLHISPRRVRNAVICDDGRARAKRVGVARQYENIKQVDTKVSIQSRITLDSVFGMVVEFQSKHNLRGVDFKPFLDDLLTKSSEAEMLAFVDHYNKTLVVTPKDGKKQAPGPFTDRKTQLSAHISYIVNLNPAPIIRGLSPSERTTLKRQTETARVRLREILDELDA